jgi:acetyl/propionyl-CoA carboxylase alpha subunit
MAMMKKVLIPNRGEIAVRIIRAAHALGIQTVVCLSELEANTIAAMLSDEVHYFKDGPFEDNYLNIALIIELAERYKADCIHPGYGFLSENNLLAEACEKAGILFVGPSADNLATMGDKQMARSIARKANVPITRSWEGSVQNILSEADTLPYPVLVKAAMGGGGKGMQVCNSKDDLLQQLPILSKQAQRYFGDQRIYVEQYITKARHIEVQVLADHHGKILHLFERECSAQRRFQKIIEEAPAPNLSQEIKQQLYNDAIHLCEAIDYRNAGTIEFLVDDTGQHYFLEMNTRIQVEHCVSEEITGVDLVQWQFKIADGQGINFDQSDLKVKGHAIELRICAEDPANNFRPSPGLIQSLILPDSKNIRLEIGIDQPVEIHSQFDPMIAKVIVHETNREIAIEAAIEANRQLIVKGIQTNAHFIDQLLNHRAYQAAQIHTRFCEDNQSALTAASCMPNNQLAAAYVAYRMTRLNKQFWRQLSEFEFTHDVQNYKAQAEYGINGIKFLLDGKEILVEAIRLNEHSLQFIFGDKQYTFHCFGNGNQIEFVHHQQTYSITVHDWLPDYQPEKSQEEKNHNAYLAPIPSQVMKINVKNGQKVKKGELLMVLEAMKTENHIKAWKDGTIETIHINAGDQVKMNQALLAYKEEQIKINES